MSEFKLRHRIASWFAPDVFGALAHSFPDFDERIDRVTAARIRKLAQSHMEMMYDTGPTEIDFTDQEGTLRRIVYDSGDWEAGISPGWTIDENETWGAFDLNASAASEASGKEDAWDWIEAKRRAAQPKRSATADAARNTDTGDK